MEIPNSVTTIGEAVFVECFTLKEIKSLNPEPPTIYNDTFYDVDKEVCKLMVPEEAVEAYKAAVGWNYFHNIVGFVPVGINITQTDVRIAGLNHAYNLSGKLVDEDYKGIVIQGGKKMIRR